MLSHVSSKLDETNLWSGPSYVAGLWVRKKRLDRTCCSGIKIYIQSCWPSQKKLQEQVDGDGHSGRTPNEKHPHESAPQAGKPTVLKLSK